MVYALVYLLLTVFNFKPSLASYGSDANRVLNIATHSQVSKIQATSESENTGDYIFISVPELVLWILYTILSAIVIIVLGYCFRRLAYHFCQHGVRGIHAIEIKVRIRREHDTIEINLSGGNQPAPTINAAMMNLELLDSETSAAALPTAMLDAASVSDALGSVTSETQFHDCVEE